MNLKNPGLYALLLGFLVWFPLNAISSDDSDRDIELEVQVAKFELAVQELGLRIQSLEIKRTEVEMERLMLHLKKAEEEGKKFLAMNTQLELKKIEIRREMQQVDLEIKKRRHDLGKFQLERLIQIAKRDKARNDDKKDDEEVGDKSDRDDDE